MEWTHTAHYGNTVLKAGAVNLYLVLYIVEVEKRYCVLFCDTISYNNFVLKD